LATISGDQDRHDFQESCEVSARKSYTCREVATITATAAAELTAGRLTTVSGSPGVTPAWCDAGRRSADAA
jgi:hypothetical protein